ncbi:MAG: SDR family oxidoreductase [Chloroflexi bacterium]|nr:SDR family oxidoreductase [Chloroflexota bacterium]
MPDQRVDLSARSALVTGAGAGHGRAIALALAASGAAVALSDINIERAERAREQIHERGGIAIALQADISNRFQAANMIEQTRDAFGKLHILVNATRIFHPEAMLSIDEWNWRRQLEVNITGVFFCMQLAGRVMADEGGGVMINLVAADGLGATAPSGIGYVVGQAAVLAMTQQAARELAPGIRVNAIAVGRDRSDKSPLAEDTRGLILPAPPTGNVAETALFLCSDAAKSLSGQVLVADERESTD